MSQFGDEVVASPVVGYLKTRNYYQFVSVRDHLEEFHETERCHYESRCGHYLKMSGYYSSFAVARF